MTNIDRAPWEDRANPVRMALEQALELADQGLPCFPCNADKTPVCRHGFKVATKDADELRQLWRHSPGVRIGIPTGEASGLFCLDVDTARHPEAVQWHDKFLQEIPATRVHKTESGGWHYLFQHHPGLRCTTSKIERGIDTRGDGGYIIWWPSHVVSIEHRFMPAAPVPGWLIMALNPPPPPSWLSHTRPHGRVQSSAPPDKRIAGIIITVARAREGERNQVTFWGACRIAEMVSTREMDPGEAQHALGLLTEAAIRAGLPLFEIRRTIASALR